MTRDEFTHANSVLETEMREAGERWVNDYWLRSAQTQFDLYKQGRKQDEKGNWVVVNQNEVVTNCDGYIKHSSHQPGCAVDKYWVKNGVIVYDCSKDAELIAKYHMWHDRAVQLGMKPIVQLSEGQLDYPHFEG